MNFLRVVTHPNIKFTKEQENENKLSFLDVKIKKVHHDANTKFLLSIFRNKTFAGLGMNFHSYTFTNFKLNNIKTLLHRAYSLCSNWDEFHEEVTFLSHCFKENGYPSNLFFSNSSFENKEEYFNVKKLTMYCKIPFLNNAAYDFIKQDLGKLFI